MTVSKLLKYMVKNNYLVPPKKVTGLVSQNFVNLKWQYSKDIKYEKCPKKKEEAKKKLKELMGPFYTNEIN